MMLTEQSYYSAEMNKKYCSASQYLSFVGRPAVPGCEARTMAELNGEYQPETTKAMQIGSILDALWEGATTEELVDRFPDCVSTRGATKGQIKSEFYQAIQMYQRTSKDPLFAKYMSGKKQVIMTGEIEGLPFKIKMDSFHPGAAIVDLKTTQDSHPSHRYYNKLTGERLAFYLWWNYDVQLAIYREIVRQNTGDELPCFIAAIDKKPHPRPEIIQLDDVLLDEALETVKQNCKKIIMLKSGEIDPIRCESDDCDYCRDTYTCKGVTSGEFETMDDKGGNGAA